MPSRTPTNNLFQASRAALAWTLHCFHVNPNLNQTPSFILVSVFGLWKARNYIHNGNSTPHNDKFPYIRILLDFSRSLDWLYSRMENFYHTSFTTVIYIFRMLHFLLLSLLSLSAARTARLPLLLPPIWYCHQKFKTTACTSLLTCFFCPCRPGDLLLLLLLLLLQRGCCNGAAAAAAASSAPAPDWSNCCW